MSSAIRVAWTLAFLSLAAGTTQASEAVGIRASYGAGAKEHVFWVDFRHKATRDRTLSLCPSEAGAEALSPDMIQEREFCHHGFRVALRQDALDYGEGVPITFAGGGMGLLTPHLLVGGLGPKALAQILPEARRIEGLVADDLLFRISLKTPEEALTALTTLRHQSGVRLVHPDFRLILESRNLESVTPEPYGSGQWHLQKTGVESAWTITRGSPQTLVALIDLGFEEEHHDLKGAWYRHEGEIPQNGIDDDGNGLVDDVNGWNFGVGSANLLYGSGPGHGTATAGIIGARMDGVGTAGLCPECRILPIVIDDQVSSAVRAFHYARERGAAIASNSWGYRVGTPETEALLEAMTRFAAEGRGGKGASIVFAMSNKARNDCQGPEPDIAATPGVIAVSSVDSQDIKVAPAGYGPCLAIVAPSSPSAKNGILTTDRVGSKGFNTGKTRDDVADPDYTKTFHGTSAAAPQVAAALALLYSVDDQIRANDAHHLLFQTAEKVQPETANYDSQTGHSLRYGYGRLHVARFLQAWRTLDRN